MRITQRLVLALQISAIIIFCFGVAVLPAFATPPDNRPPDNRPPSRGNDVEQTQTQGQHQVQGQIQGQTTNVETQATSEATATSESTAAAASYSEGGSGGAGGAGGAGGLAQNNTNIGDTTATGGSAQAEGGRSEAQGGSVGDINISGDNIPADTTHKSDIRIENTPDTVTITPGSGDSCKAHIGGNLSLPGLGTGLTIPLPGKECRKLKYYDRMIAMGDKNAAEIIFCSLKEIKREFRELDLPCRETLSIHTDVPVGQMTITEDEYNSLMMAQVQQEEVEQLEDRYMEQQARIEELEEEVATHDSEQEDIEQLKKDAAALRRAQAARDKEREAFRATAKARLAAREEQGSEEKEDPNE